MSSDTRADRPSDKSSSMERQITNDEPDDSFAIGTNIPKNITDLLDPKVLQKQVLQMVVDASFDNVDVSGYLNVLGKSILDNVDTKLANSTILNTGFISVDNELIIGETSTFSVQNQIDVINTQITTINSNIDNIDSSIVHIKNNYVEKIIFNDLSSRFYILENSFQLLDLSAIRDFVFNDLSNRFYILESSFNALDLSNFKHQIFYDLSKNFYDLSSSHHTLKSITVKNTIFNDLSRNFYNLDNSFTLLDLSNFKFNIFKDLSQSFYNLEISFNNLIDNSFNKLYQDFYELSRNYYITEYSFNQLNSYNESFRNKSIILDNIYDLSSNFYSLKTLFNDLSGLTYKIDNSLHLLDISAVRDNVFAELSSNFYSLQSNFNDLSNHYTQISVFNDLSNNFYYLESSFISLEASAILDYTFTTLSGNVSKLNADFNTLSGDVYDISNTVIKNYNDISFLYSYFELSDNRIVVNFPMDISKLYLLNDELLIKQDISYTSLETTDSSKNHILTFNQINELLVQRDFLLSSTFNDSIASIGRNQLIVNDASQTFFEVMTQQPNKFDKINDGLTNTSTDSVTINWNFDSILVKQDNKILNARLAFLEDSTNLKLKQLPYINEIKIEISGNIDINDSSNGLWIDFSTIQITDISNYDILQNKYFVINQSSNTDNNVNSILSKTELFDIRVYGINYANNFPNINSRSLYFNNLKFGGQGVPSQPRLLSDISFNKNQTNNEQKYTLTLDVSDVDICSNYANTYITGYYITTNIVDDLRDDYLNYNKVGLNSYNIPIIDFNLNRTDIYANVPFSIEIFSKTNSNSIIYYGSRFKYDIKVRNSLGDTTWSEVLPVTTKNFSRIPRSNGITSTFNINSKLQSSNNNKLILSKTYSKNINYINYNIESFKHLLISSNNHNFQITYDLANNLDTTNNYGYGKELNNKENVVSLSVFYNDICYQELLFDASWAKTQPTENKHNDIIEKPFISFTGDIIRDFAGSTNTVANNFKKGFRLVAENLRFNTIDISHLNALNIEPSNSIYSIQYNYTRDPIVNDYYNNSYDLSFVLDDLNLVPSMLYENNIHINNLIYCMGIPSVKRFNIDMSRTYIDINSNTMLLEKNGLNNNSIISKINKPSSLNYNNYNNEINVLLEQNLIDETGLYQFNDISNILENSGYFNNLTYQQSILTTDYSLNWNEKVENFYTKLSNIDINYDISLITNHYCDKNSFDSNLSTCNLNLNNMDIYEVTDISALFKTPIADLCYNTLFEKYDDHTKKVKEHTLLYINNKFQNVNTQPYPNISDFSYNNLTNDITNNLYDSSNQQYDFNGDLSDNGFKWIAIKLEKYYISDYNYGFSFNGENFQINSNSNGYYYLDISNMIHTINIFISNNFYNYPFSLQETLYYDKILFFLTINNINIYLDNNIDTLATSWYTLDQSFKNTYTDIEDPTLNDIISNNINVSNYIETKTYDRWIGGYVSDTDNPSNPNYSLLRMFPPSSISAVGNYFYLILGIKN
tara:strand:- start:1364 stop:5863 length:4500 start_codon:yes stop_codon:yes gene_type:complete